MRGFGIWTSLIGAGLVAAAAPALADDPHDRSMTPEAIARDHAMTRALNEGQIAYLRERDARYAQGWSDYRDYHAGQRDSAPASREVSGSANADYADARREYESAMADWRRDVAACRAGRYERCAR